MCTNVISTNVSTLFFHEIYTSLKPKETWVNLIKAYFSQEKLKVLAPITKADKEILNSFIP